MKTYKIIGLCVLTFVFYQDILSQQTDSSSYFPLGLWGIWIDKTQAPFIASLNSSQWNQEISNWQQIKGNFLVAWTPMSVEASVMQFADANGYKMAITNGNWAYPSSWNSDCLTVWLSSGDLSDTSAAISIINEVKNLYYGHAGFHSYFLDDEHSVYDSSRWPGVEFVAEKIHQLDPGRKSYISSGPVPPQSFFDATPSLDIFQFDQYPFTSNDQQTYLYQQSALDNSLVGYYSDLMNRLRGKTTEWQAIIQSQEDVHTPGNAYYRRPNFYELRAQAYLALSRGARGITYFVYGSSNPGPVNPPVQQYSGLTDQTLGYKGLVDLDPNLQIRLKWEQVHSTDPVAFDNVKNLNTELAPLGPTIRKLRVYDAFRHGAIPTDNIAHIVPSSITSNYTLADVKIEFGTFKRFDQGTDSSLYFMVVNRVCNDPSGSATAQTITFKVNGYPSVGPYYLQDQRTKSNILYTTYYTGNMYSKFTITLGPGEGKLFWLYPYAAPSAPQNVALANVNDHPRITWSSNSERNIDHYYIYRNTGGGYSELASVSSSTTTFTDNEVYIGTPGKYSPVATYYVTTVNSVNLQSPASRYVSTQFSALGKEYAATQEIPQEIPKEFGLMQNYPNPFNPTTSVSYALPEAAVVRLIVSDNLGRDVATLVNEYREAGYYEANFDASRLSSGIYFYKIEAGKFNAVKKMLLMK